MAWIMCEYKIYASKRIFGESVIIRLPVKEIMQRVPYHFH